jgi:glycerol uptake facilitator-like aquaporin
MKFTLGARLTAEFIGTAFLVAAVVGSGVMGEKLSGGNVALALLANTIATGAALVALIAGICGHIPRSPQSSRHTDRCV